MLHTCSHISVSDRGINVLASQINVISTWACVAGVLINRSADIMQIYYKQIYKRAKFT